MLFRSVSQSRYELGELGTEGMTVIRDITNTLMPVELKWPTCLRTYEKMKFDSAVSSALDLKYILIEKRFSKAEVRFNKESEASKQAAAEKVKYDIEGRKSAIKLLEETRDSKILNTKQ